MAKAATSAVKKAATKTSIKAAPKKAVAPKKSAPVKAVPAKKAAPAKKLAPAKKAPAKVAKKVAPKKAKRKPNAAFMAPLTVSNSLADVIGKKPMPRTEIIKKIWDYIKKNGLQDKINRRMINADNKLALIFGGKKQISMFELAKVVNDQIQK